MNSSRLRRLCIVVPMFNEEKVLSNFRIRLERVLDSLRCTKELIVVDDGSTDQTADLLHEWAVNNSYVRVICLSRNFGQEAAIIAGLDQVDSDAVIVMDCDLQDPPELIPQLIEKFEEGFDVVYARRSSRESEGIFKRWTAWAFYRCMALCANSVTHLDSGCFRLLSREAMVPLLEMREFHRFFRGLSAWVGFRQIGIFFERPGRAAGETKFTPFTMLRLSADAAFSFTTAPLRFAAILGMLTIIFGIFYTGYALIEKYYLCATVPGWTALVIFQALLGGAILLYLGILGEYVARIFEQTKGRPLYIIRSVAGSGSHLCSLQSVKRLSSVSRNRGLGSEG